MNHIGFRNLKRYKYQLIKYYRHQTPIKIKRGVKIKGFVKLSSKGLLVVSKGYAWDGPSGPTIDTKDFMRGSLVHDALYQLIRMKRLSMSERKQADKLLRQMCREDGMGWFRAFYVYWGLRIFARSAAKPRTDDIQIIEAP